MTSENTKSFGGKAHAGQKRLDSSDYFETHCLGALKIFEEKYSGCARMPTDVADAVCLHDTIEDTDVTYAQLKEEFGSTVANLVSIVSKQEGEQYAPFIIRIIESGDPDAILVKLCDLEYNMSDLKKGSMLDKYKLAHYMLTQAFTKIHTKS